MGVASRPEAVATVWQGVAAGKTASQPAGRVLGGGGRRRGAKIPRRSLRIGRRNIPEARRKGAVRRRKRSEACRRGRRGLARSAGDCIWRGGIVLCACHPSFFAHNRPRSLAGHRPMAVFAMHGDGVLAQLVERLVRNEKVRGSNPLGSTIHPQSCRQPPVLPFPAHFSSRTNAVAGLPVENPPESLINELCNSTS